MAQGLRVLDAACGSGYGTAQLVGAGGAASGIGVDLSQESIDAARARYGGTGAEFRQADILNLDFPDGAFDFIASFETIEHISDDSAYVSEMRRVLRPGGLLLCSTPNRLVTNPGTTISEPPYNPYHVREYTKEELHAKLSARFHSISMLGQMTWSESYCLMLARAASFSRMLAVRVHQVRKVLRSPFDRIDDFRPQQLTAGREPETLIAMCS